VKRQRAETAEEIKMRKTIVPHKSLDAKEFEEEWLDLENLAQAEVSSEDPSHPIEAALQSGRGAGWRAAEPGKQVVRLVFDEPQVVKRIELEIIEEERFRTQELVLRWSQDHGRTYREIVRQQFNFAPPGTGKEKEEYRVELAGVTAVELEITPDISGPGAKASLARLRLA
jgi:uncharacterized protein (DUF736 family)